MEKKELSKMKRRVKTLQKQLGQLESVRYLELLTRQILTFKKDLS